MIMHIYPAVCPELSNVCPLLVGVQVTCRRSDSAGGLRGSAVCMESYCNTTPEYCATEDTERDF